MLKLVVALMGMVFQQDALQASHFARGKGLRKIQSSELSSNFSINDSHDNDITTNLEFDWSSEEK